MVDIGIQSETDDLSDAETSLQGNAADRKPSLLQVVPEEEYEDGELVTNVPFCSASLVNEIHCTQL